MWPHRAFPDSDAGVGIHSPPLFSAVLALPLIRSQWEEMDMANSVLCADIQRASLERDIMLRDAAVLQLRQRELSHRAKPLGLPDVCDLQSRLHLRDEGEEGTSTCSPDFSPPWNSEALSRDAAELKFRQWELSQRFCTLPDACDFTSHGAHLPTEFTPGPSFSHLTPPWLDERDIRWRNPELHSSDSSDSSEDGFPLGDNGFIRHPVP